ncbi:MAG TPA: hypothetical protein VK769_03730 [Verrucomicrobiae bacterium]|nr:hypothetical protein [Verrucomicrobiae bacterium]
MKLALHRFYDSTVQRFVVLCVLVFELSAHAQSPLSGMISTRSISGQFIVVGPKQISTIASSFAVRTNSQLIRLDPALLAISAERIKDSLWHELGINNQWRGQIFLALHSARSPDENVTIVSTKFSGGWDYHVELPDILSRTRFMRAMTGVTLLEFANRNADARSAEIPPWLVDGLSQELLAPGDSETILSSPDSTINGFAENRTVTTQRGLDPLAGARRVLNNSAALTFDQLSWPDDDQLFGEDGGIYRASAQLFVSEILRSKNGTANLRAMLESLPQFYNWQTAFQKAFREKFSSPLDVEKWWALRVVSFAARDPGSMWTPATSREKLDEILSASVEFRSLSNNLPTHAEVSLQAVIRNFDSARQTEILQTKLRDLGLAQLRVSPQFAALTDSYRRAVADYLGQDGKPPTPNRRVKKTGTNDTLKKLDALDAQRRTIEETIKPDIFAPRDLNAPPP